jgi:hypothetical protein
MSNESMLAAVSRAAAATTELPATAGNNPGENEMSTTDKPAVLSAATAITTLAGLTAAYPLLCGDLRVEAASAERARILGIEANALPGHEKLVADMKADASITPDMAAGRILAAERALRGSAAQAIRDVEQATGVVAPAPASVAPAPASKASTPEGWKAEYAASGALQGEFATAEDYAAFKEAEAAGKVRFLRNRAG